ncbi:MAG: nicotinamide-nucleotide adenylyltransferase [Candidatus Thermoplasmatota archaeon]|nr:nicotinamide-nucleotide adenylyltransferase [Candidatus Thermoplasmatota archaeon]MBU4070701.1 nicotinamide-nucleotide adenylyltransferase [Candidatus Thermoplasmatota archaeon]MBU4144102.1 nicotinamide-nucleotide adenylyltransferase [Candidatus Thermoplasmatota archaeon]MBU4591831.1 nicotinamide-nucleotide adenylyltransferase [Candidatus Thermoplasmatota archaeon]
MTAGLFLGRFQPFHEGHLEVVREIATQVDKLVIAIGSAQESHTLEDPFTAGERHLMISETLDAEGIDNYYLIPIVDINRYSIWVAHVRSLVPPFEMIFTNNELTARLFSEAGTEVRRTKLYDRDRYSGKKVRELLISCGDWRILVPDGTEHVIDLIGGEKRLRDLAGGIG